MEIKILIIEIIQIITVIIMVKTDLIIEIIKMDKINMEIINKDKTLIDLKDL